MNLNQFSLAITLIFFGFFTVSAQDIYKSNTHLCEAQIAESENNFQKALQLYQESFNDLTPYFIYEDAAKVALELKDRVTHLRRMTFNLLDGNSVAHTVRLSYPR